MEFIDNLPTTIIGLIGRGAWSSPRSAMLLEHAALVRNAVASGIGSDDLVDTLVTSARTEIAATPEPTGIMTVMISGLRDWQSSARSAACRGFVVHGGYSNAEEALAVARRMTATAAMDAAA